MKFRIDYVIPPPRAYYHENYTAETEAQAIEMFKKDHPKGQINRITQEN